MSWYPITDPDRAADIRMRRRRALLLLGSIVFVPWMLWGDHHAGHVPMRLHARFAPSVARKGAAGLASRQISADALQIDLPCASRVTVLPDPALSGQAILSAPDAVLDALRISNGSFAGNGGCADDSPITIRAGNTMPLHLIQSGDNDAVIGRFDSAVSIDSRGSGSVSLEHAGNLVVRSNQSGDVTVGSVSGTVTATLGGSGDLRINGGTIPVLEAVSRGSADLLLDRVQVLGGRVTLQGSGDLRLAGSSGAFEASTYGSGDIAINTVNNDRLTLDGGGSGSIKIGSGHIGWLQASRRGSGDLAIDAAIDGGRLRHGGEGDVSIPSAPTLIRER